MTTKKKTFWLGELVGNRRVGEIKVDGKLYTIGEEIPADKIEKDRLSHLRKAGSIGDAVFDFVESASGDAKDKDILMLQGKLSEAAAENFELKIDAIKNGDKIAGLELEVEEAGGGGDVELKKEIVELNSEVERLTAEVKEAVELKAAHIKAHAEKTEKKDGKK